MHNQCYIPTINSKMKDISSDIALLSHISLGHINIIVYQLIKTIDISIVYRIHDWRESTCSIDCLVYVKTIVHGMIEDAASQIMCQVTADIVSVVFEGHII